MRGTPEATSPGVPGLRGLPRPVARVGVTATLCLFLSALALPQTCFGEGELPVLRRRPSPMGALLRSTVAPGWGQWYVGRKPKGVVLAATAAALVWHGVAAHQDGREKDRQKLTVWASVLWLYAMTDAYVGAHLSRFEQEMQEAGSVRVAPEEK